MRDSTMTTVRDLIIVADNKMISNVAMRFSFFKSEERRSNETCALATDLALRRIPACARACAPKPGTGSSDHPRVVIRRMTSGIPRKCVTQMTPGDHCAIISSFTDDVRPELGAMSRRCLRTLRFCEVRGVPPGCAGRPSIHHDRYFEIRLRRNNQRHFSVSLQIPGKRTRRSQIRR